DGENGITSTNAAADVAYKTAIGYGEAAALGVGRFGGELVDSTSVLLRYTLAGDANLDGNVDTIDFNNLAGNFGSTGKVWTQGDFNYDGIIDTVDFNLLASNFGSVLSSANALVPEPAVFAPLAVPIAGLIHRRRQTVRHRL